MNNVVGESIWDKMRMRRRVIGNKFYYARQEVLYKVFIEMPDVASMIGIYPKVDNSHGFGFNSNNMHTCRYV